jgi:hypothetical protein
MQQGWHETERGFSDRRYEVVLEAPSRWLLTVSGRVHSRHSTASAAKLEAEHLDRRLRRELRLVRLGAGLAVVIALLAVVGWQRVGPSPDRKAAEALVARLDSIYRSIDGVSIDEFRAPDIRGARVSLADGEQLSVLVGRAGEACYVLYWSPTRQRTARVLDVSHGVPCDAGVAIGLWNLDWRQAQSEWDPILPSQVEERVWFLPAVALLSGVGLSLLWRFIVALGRPTGS